MGAGIVIVLIHMTIQALLTLPVQQELKIRQLIVPGMEPRIY
jgi:hypothetical protein